MAQASGALPPPALAALLGRPAGRPATLYALGPFAPAAWRAAEGAVLDAAPALVDLRAACADPVHLAAALACMDLVLAVDGPVLHLAGALGRPVWALLSAAPDWRWMHHQRRSPWYPTARLFRRAPGADAADWAPVLAEIGAALADL